MSFAQMLLRANVASRKCRFAQMSLHANVTSHKCRFAQMSLNQLDNNKCSKLSVIFISYEENEVLEYDSRFKTWDNKWILAARKFSLYLYSADIHRGYMVWVDIIFFFIAVWQHWFYKNIYATPWIMKLKMGFFLLFVLCHQRWLTGSGLVLSP